MGQIEKKQEPVPQEPTPTEPLPRDLKDQKLEEDTDELIEEIDRVLEEDPEVFVRNYIQRGGQ